MYRAVPSPSTVGLVAMTTSRNDPAADPLDQGLDGELVRADPFQGGNAAQQHVIQAAVHARLLQGHQVPRLLDDAQRRRAPGAGSRQISHSSSSAKL